MSKQDARALWSETPAGSSTVGGAPEARATFEAARRWRSEVEQPWLRTLVPFEALRDKLVLEVGCGAGFDAHALCSAGARYVGVDLADANPARARRNLVDAGLPPPRVLQADAERLPFADGTFDVVYSNGVLHHAPDMGRALAEAGRVLRPGGSLYVIVYHRDSVFHWVRMVGYDLLLRRQLLQMSYRDRLSQVEFSNDAALRPTVHVTSRGGLRRMLADAGLTLDALDVRKLTRADFPTPDRPRLQRLATSMLDAIPDGALDALGRWVGWYLVARATKLGERLTVVRDPPRQPPAPGEERVPFATLRGWFRSGEVLRRLRRYEEAQVTTARLEVQPRPFLTALALSAVARKAEFVDARGQRAPLGPAAIARLGLEAARAFARRPGVLARVTAEVAALGAAPRPAARPLDPSARPIYLRTNLDFDLRAGGSVGHVAGVLNNLGEFLPAPLFITTDRVATVRPDIETILIPLPEDFRELPYLRGLHLNLAVREQVLEAARRAGPSLVYQRYDLYDYLGLDVARRLGVPYVLEYNGSEVWITRQWGSGRLPHADLAEAIENVDLRGADLVVVVSDVLKEELVGRGVEPTRILVNANGVDPDRYSPVIDGRAVRRRLGLEGKTVVGFIGTFGPWHGAEPLVEAFARLLSDRPDLRAGTRLLLIGDGARMPAVRELIVRHGLPDACVLTGLVPQPEGPAHLAACDVLASPHVPNPDGTRFFGSPTKLFEYMAMGKGIVASRLEQVGEVLDDGETALLVPPGDVAALAAGLGRLVTDAGLRARLGAAARARAIERHTWRAHTARIVDALEELSRATPGGQS